MMGFAGKSSGEMVDSTVAIEFRANGMHDKMKGLNGGVRCMDRRSTELEGREVCLAGGWIGRYRENVLDRAVATQDGCLLGVLGVLVCWGMTREYGVPG